MQGHELVGSAYILAQSIPSRKVGQALGDIAKTLSNPVIRPVVRKITENTVTNKAQYAQIAAAVNKYVKSSVQSSVKKVLLPSQRGRGPSKIHQSAGAVGSFAFVGLLLSYVVVLENIVEDAFKYTYEFAALKVLDLERAKMLMIATSEKLKEITATAVPRIEGTLSLATSADSNSIYLSIVFLLMVMLFLVIRRIPSTKGKQQQMETLVQQIKQQPLQMKTQKQQQAKRTQQQAKRTQQQAKKAQQQANRTQQQAKRKEQELRQITNKNKRMAQQIARLQAQLGITKS